MALPAYYTSTPGTNTNINGISVAEGMLRSDVNNAFRQLMADLYNFNAGLSTVSAATVDALKDVPQVTKTASYTLALTDRGGHVSITTGGIIIPANATVAFGIGAVVTIYNDSAATQALTIATDTLRLAGSATTGARTIAQRGLVTLLKIKATEWVCNGNVS